MNNSAIVQYLGFHAKRLVREYTFSVREAGNEPHEFTLAIPNEAFNSHRARYQDGPDICSLKLQQELTSHANHPAENHFRITDAELENYRGAHAPKSARNIYAAKVARNL